MADEDDRKWLPPTDPDDDKTGDTLPGVPGSFSGQGPSLSKGDPLGGSSDAPTGEGTSGLWSKQPGGQAPPPPQQPPSPWGPPQQTGSSGGWAPPPAPPQQQPPFGQQSYPPYGGGQATQTNSKAVASLVLSIVGITICPVIGSILGLVFGYQGRAEIDRNPSQSGRGMATAGIIIGWIGLILSLLGIILVVIGVLAVDDWDWDTTTNDDFGRPAMLALGLG